jgi:hypothetical protein
MKKISTPFYNLIQEEDEFSTTESFCKSKQNVKKNKFFKSVKKVNNNHEIQTKSKSPQCSYNKIDKIKTYNNNILEREVKVGEFVEQIKEKYQNDILKKKLSYLEMANKKVNNFNQIINKRPKNSEKEGIIYFYLKFKIESTLSNMYNFVENMFEVQPGQSNTGTKTVEKETCIVF